MGAHSSFREARRADRTSPCAPRGWRNRARRSLRQPKERVARKQPTVFRPPQRSALGQKFPNLNAKPARNRRDIRHLCANQGFTSVCQAEQFVIRERLRTGIPGCHARSLPCRRRNPHFLIRERLQAGIPECRARSSLACHSAPGRARPPGRAVRWRARRSGPASDRSARPAARP